MNTVQIRDLTETIKKLKRDAHLFRIRTDQVKDSVQRAEMEKQYLEMRRKLASLSSQMREIAVEDNSYRLRTLIRVIRTRLGDEVMDKLWLAVDEEMAASDVDRGSMSALPPQSGSGSFKDRPTKDARVTMPVREES